MFPEFRELITQLKTSDRHFLRLFDQHNELDQKINGEDQFLYWNQMMTIGCTFAFPLTAERTP